jgi:4-amino-4-deoxy-L-arabinose transferase-like glycosyltransferase
VQYDEADAASLVAAWWLDGRFPIAGTVGSTGLVNPPGWPYILATGLNINPSPYALLSVGVVVGCLTVLLTWWIARRWFGIWAGLAAATFYAGGFFPVFLGRTAWQLAFLPPLTLLCLDALLTLAVRRRPWALVVACGWLGVMFQFHYVEAIYALMLPVAAWPARRSLRARHFSVALLVAIIATYPFALYEVHPQVRFADLLGLIVSQGGTAQVDLSVFNYLWNLSSNAGAIGLAAPSEAGLRPLIGRWAAAGQVGSVLAGLGTLAAVVWWPRGWRGWLVSGWLLLPQLVFLRHSLDVLLHYLFPELPVLALAVGVLAGGIAARLRHAFALGAGTIVGAGLLAYVGASLGTVFLVLEYAATADAHLGYGIPLMFNVEAGAATRAILTPRTARVLIGAQHYEGEILRLTIGFDTPSRTFDDCREIPFDPAAIYVLMSEQTPGAGVLEAAGSQLVARIPRPGDAYRVYSSPSQPGESDTARLPGYDSTECRERRAADATLPTLTGP